MQRYNNVWRRALFAIALIALAIQQLICGDFRPVFVPPLFRSWLPAREVCNWLFSLFLIGASVAMIAKRKARSISLLLGGLLLLFVVLLHIPYELNLYPGQLAAWSDPLKCLTLSGGAFIVAGSLPAEGRTSSLLRLLEKLIPFGKYFLALTLVVFGTEHFVYAGFVEMLVPGWIPGHPFWTYFAGTALMAAGVGIMFNIKRRLAALLLGIMVFRGFLSCTFPGPLPTRTVAMVTSGPACLKHWHLAALLFCLPVIGWMIPQRLMPTGHKEKRKAGHLASLFTLLFVVLDNLWGIRCRFLPKTTASLSVAEALLAFSHTPQNRPRKALSPRGF